MDTSVEFDTPHRGQEIQFDYRDYQNAEADKNLAVKFFLHPLPNDEKTEKEKRPMFDDTEFIEIRVRGDRLNCVQRPAREDDRRRFRGAYRAFKDNEEQAVSGTPLKEWPTMTKSMVEELKYLGFVTVEQLSQASDNICAKVAGLQHFKQKAILYLEYAKGAKPLDQLQRQIEEANNEKAVMGRNLEELARSNAALMARIEALETKPKK